MLIIDYRSLKAKWDSNFIKALSESTENGHMQFRDAYLLTNTTGKTFLFYEKDGFSSLTHHIYG